MVVQIFQIRDTIVSTQNCHVDVNRCMYDKFNHFGSRSTLMLHCAGIAKQQHFQ